MEKQVTIVFGATGKVGADTCRALSRMGHTVVVHYFHSRAKAESIVADIEHSGGSAMALQADVREEDQTCALVRAVVERYGAVHTVVDFVHRDDYAPTEVADMTWEDWGCHLDAIKSYFCICKAVLPVMKQQQYGRIIYISGGLAYRFFKGCAPYSAVKAGMNAFSKSLAGEVGKDHITVNVVAPGKVVCKSDETQERFSEDALRMLRAVRFAAQLGFAIEAETKEAMVKLAPDIAKISAERIQTELVKLITSAHPGEIRTAWETGLTAVFLPEFDRMMATPQNTKHHCYSVGEHTVAALEHIVGDKVLRLTMLLHDVAKPVCRTTDASGNDHFYGHPKEGSEMARKILRRLKFDNDTTDKVCRLVCWHDDNPPLSEKNVRRAVSRIGVEQYPALFAVKRADILAQSEYQREEKLSYVDGYEALYREILEKNQCLTIRDLAVNGSDLIAAGMKPGKEIGETLKSLLELVLDDPELNNRELLLERICSHE